MGKKGDIAPTALEQCVLMICEIIQAFDLGYAVPLETAMDVLGRAAQAQIKIDSIKALRAVPQAAPQAAAAKKKKDKGCACTYSS